MGSSKDKGKGTGPPKDNQPPKCKPQRKLQLVDESEEDEIEAMISGRQPAKKKKPEKTDKEPFVLPPETLTEKSRLDNTRFVSLAAQKSYLEEQEEEMPDAEQDDEAAQTQVPPAAGSMDEVMEMLRTMQVQQQAMQRGQDDFYGAVNRRLDTISGDIQEMADSSCGYYHSDFLCFLFLFFIFVFFFFLFWNLEQ